MQPVAFATDIDAGLIGMRHLRASQLILGPDFKARQQLKGLLVEIEDRTLTDWYLKLVGKIILDPLIGQQLKV